MTGRSKALDRAMAHERRRGHRLPLSREERAYIRSHEVQVVRWMNAVDRGVEHYRKVRDAA